MTGWGSGASLVQIHLKWLGSPALAGSKSGSNPPKGGTPTSPIAKLRERMTDHPVSNNTGIPFIGGAVGFIAYDYGPSFGAYSGTGGR